MRAFGKERAYPTLLLIDDDLVSREVLATVLTMSGYAVHTTATGAEALRMVETGLCEPDAILMDTLMPGISGVDLIAGLRLRTRAMIVAISASIMPPEVKSAADATLQKPFGNQQLQPLLEGHAQAGIRDQAQVLYESAMERLEASSRRMDEIRLALENAELPIPPQPPVLERIPSHTESEIINPVTLDQMRSLMAPPAIAEIFRAVVADLETRSMQLEKALESGDQEALRRIGHSIKGGCGMAGASEAARLGREIERLATVGEVGINEVDNGAHWVEELRTATLRLRRILDTEFSV